MNRIKSLISIMLAITLTFSLLNYFAITVRADKNYDVVAPIVSNVVIENSQDINADGIININLDVVEDGLGINQCTIIFESKEFNQTIALSYKVTVDNNNKLLFTGNHKLKFDLKTQKVYFLEGVYQAKKVIVVDVANNESTYNLDKEILVTNSNIKDKQAPIITCMVINKSDDFRCDRYNEASISVEEDTGIKRLQLIYKNDDGQEIIIGAKNIEGLLTGTHQIQLYLETKFIQQKGDYYLESFTVEDLYGNTFTNETEFDDCSKKITINWIPTEGKEGVSLNSIEILNSNIVTPNVLSLKININPGTEGLKGVNVSIINENGNKKALYWETQEPIVKNEVIIKLPINTYLENGHYIIDKITVYSDNFITSYEEQSLNIIMKNNHSIEIKGKYDVTYYGSTANTNGVIKAIENMEEGQVAIAEYSIRSIADKSIFEAMAGKNVTLVFEGYDVQWVFNGIDIKKDKCKSIDLAVKMSTLTGTQLGFANEESMLVIDFMSNGELPGKAKIRLSNEYLKVKYSYKQDLVLTYYDVNPQQINGKINCQNDGFAEIEITHNSRYIISENAPRLAAPGEFEVIENGTKNNTLYWTKVFGANGYKVYRATKSESQYTLVKTIYGNELNKYSYIDNDLEQGELYYYRVCAYASNVTAVYTKSKSIRVLPNKATLKIKYVNKKKRKAKIYMKTTDKNKSYVVYTSKNGKKYKRVKTLKNKSSCIIKLNKKKTYIKVRAYVVLDGKKYYGKYSNVKKIK